MEQLKAFKYRIYPNEAQANQLAQNFGAKRWTWNHFLHIQKERFLAKEKHLTHFDINKLITPLKKEEETEWLRGIDDWALKNASEDLHHAYSNFFNSIKGKRRGKKMELPRFKKRSNQQSYRTRNIKIAEGKIKLPKIAPISISIDRPISGTIKSATVSQTPSGRYFVSVLVSTDIPLLPMTGREVGIDLGLKDLMILSNGIKFEHPARLLAKATQQRKKQQIKLARKVKGSKKWKSTRLKVAMYYEQATNQRNWYYHNLSTHLVNTYDAIHMEDLNVAGMIRNRCLSRKIHESGWSSLANMIEYKCDWSGKTFYKISRWFPSTKTCSECGHKIDHIDLKVRAWECPECGAVHDRDINAALNIKRKGQMDLYDRVIPSDDIAEEDTFAGVPTSLQKFAVKTERPSAGVLVGEGSRKTEPLGAR